MRLTFENITENPTNLLRRVGYSFQRHADAGEMSFIRPCARSGFPRFHVYSSMEGTTLLISIHLDQKKETYGKDVRHHGEYEDDGALKKEVEGIREMIVQS